VAVKEQAVKVLGTHLADDRLAARDLQEHGLRPVAREATGMYWIPWHDLWQAAGLAVTVCRGQLSTRHTISHENRTVTTVASFGSAENGLERAG